MSPRYGLSEAGPPPEALPSLEHYGGVTRPQPHPRPRYGEPAGPTSPESSWDEWVETPPAVEISDWDTEPYYPPAPGVEQPTESRVKQKLEKAVAWVGRRWDAIDATPNPRSRRAKKIGLIAIAAITQIGAITGAGVVASETVQADAPKVILEQGNDQQFENLQEEVLVENPSYEEWFMDAAAKQEDNNSDPSYRAGSVTIVGEANDVSDSVYLGTGAIIERDGHLYYGTAQHVTDGMVSEASGSERNPTIFVPGVGYMKLDRFSEAQSVDLNPENTPESLSDDDGNTLTPFTKQQEELLRGYQERGVISPLTPATEAPIEGRRYTMTHPESGEEVELIYSGSVPGLAYGEVGSLVGFDEFIVERFVDQDLSADGEIDYEDDAVIASTIEANTDNLPEYVADYLCQGASGGYVTDSEGSVYGSLSSVRTVFTDDGRACGVQVAIVPA